MKITILTIICIVFSMNTFSQESGEGSSVTSTSSSSSSGNLRNGWELGIGSYQMDNEFEDGDSESLSGSTLMGSYNFVLSDRWHTKTSLRFIGASGENKDKLFDSKTDFSGSDISQNISYVIPVNGITVKPFISIGFGGGEYNQEMDGFSEEDMELLGIKSLDITSDYSVSTSAIGIQAILKNGISPFISFETTSIVFEDVKTKHKKSGSKDKVAIESSMADITSNVVSAGLAYAF